MIVDTIHTYNRDLYNSLWAIERVDSVLNSTNTFPIFLEEAGLLFRAYRISTKFGVCLLHKHYSLTDDQYPIEFAENLVEGDALVTKAVSQISRKLEANRWKLTKAGLIPLEFSEAECLPPSTSSEMQCMPDAFFCDLHLLLRNYGFQDLIGFCVAERRFYAGKPSDAIAIEATDLAAKANIVTITNESLLEGRYVETCWQFPWKETEAAVVTCPRVCNAYCYIIFDHKPGHYNIHSGHH
ncbi:MULTISPECIES: hypothetical protein [unclassified Duganella]|uniref:hypothetical protein n=1 Tax=unclassified Duganella TaxID=2636909 RepID=UPI0011C109E3|nr:MULTISPECIES: hypothetical protein [unclassified Duganella]